MELILDGIGIVAGTALDVLPIAVFMFVFHGLVIGGRMADRNRIIIGFVLVIAGLGCFLVGLEQALFPLGRLMAEQLTSAELLGDAHGTSGALNWADYYWVYLFAFAIGFSTTLAEPSMLAVAIKAHEVSGGAISPWGLRVAVALGVAIGVALGCFRIVTGTSLQYYVMAGYLMVIVQTMVAPKLIVPLAYDSGGVTTSTVTVPLVTALGLGLAEAVPGRSPLLDGFGLVAFASLFPIISVLAYAQLAALVSAHSARRSGAVRDDPAKTHDKETDHAL